MSPFFPDSLFAWLFCLVLFGFLTAASIIDVRTLRLPKTLTISLFVVGLLASTLRGVLLAWQDKPVFIFHSSSPWMGALDGFLFALVGSLVGFAFFAILFALGTCGGGDVKLFTAIGAWLGAANGFWVLVVSIVLVAGFVLVVGVLRLFGDPRKILRMKPGTGRKKDAIIVNFSVPVSLACLVVCGWMFRYELQLVKRNVNQPVVEVSNAKKS